MAPATLPKGLLPNSIDLTIRQDFSLNIAFLKVVILYLNMVQYHVINKIEK